ncbi:hypothetical protein AOQ84DRAFT_221966, partial [Glonium stellatum]
MTTDMSQLVKLLSARFLSKPASIAESCRPQLHEWIEEPLEVISFTPDPEAWLKHQPVHRISIDEPATTPPGKETTQSPPPTPTA